MPDRYAYLKWVAMKTRCLGIRLTLLITVWDKTANFNKAIINSKRIQNNAQFRLIEENAKWIDNRSKENNYSLNIDKFKVEQNAVEEAAKKYKPIMQYKIHYNLLLFLMRLSKW
jgi:carboxyl-terminal processing protease